MDMFACQHCSAVPELVIDGRAQLSIVRHALGCLTLQAQVRARWPRNQPAFQTRRPRCRLSAEPHSGGGTASCGHARNGASKGRCPAGGPLAFGRELRVAVPVVKKVPLRQVLPHEDKVAKIFVRQAN